MNGPGETMSIESNDKDIARKYRDGKAPAAYYAFREIKRSMDPIGPGEAGSA